VVLAGTVALIIPEEETINKHLKFHQVWVIFKSLMMKSIPMITSVVLEEEMNSHSPRQTDREG